MLSFWEKDLFDKHFDCIVIGAGFTGLNTALAFKEHFAKASVLVVDDGAGFKGASTKNAGFACYGSPSELVSDMALMGEDAALKLLSQRKKGIDAIAKRYKNSLIYSVGKAYELFLERNKNLWEDSRTSIHKLNKLVEESTGLSDAYSVCKEPQVSTAVGTIEIRGEGQIHPARLHADLYQKALSNGIHFYKERALAFENDGISGTRTMLGNGQDLRSTWLVNCVNGFDGRLTKNSQVAPARAQVLITGKIENLPYSGNYHMDEGYFYFRNVGDRLLLGGGRNLAFEEEMTDEIQLNTLIQEKLKAILRTELLPGHSFEITDQWAGIMGMRSDKTPAIEQDGNCLSVVGLSGMGVALSFYLPQLAVERIC